MKMLQASRRNMMRGAVGIMLESIVIAYLIFSCSQLQPELKPTYFVPLLSMIYVALEVTRSLMTRIQLFGSAYADYKRAKKELEQCRCKCWR